ncbi:MAG: HypC/HybG/HupF family hydrogenase formation chaperone [Dehalococcoidia bacterium]
MCLPLVARVSVVEGEQAEVELLGDGGQAQVSLALYPDIVAGQYVLVDRGMVIEAIEPAQAEELLAFYTELGQMWDQEEVAVE